MTEELRKRGGQPGNQNARTHGFYSCVLDESQQMDFARATEFDGLDDEIALLRVKLKSIVEHDPENIRLIMHAMESLTKLVRMKYNMSKTDHRSLKEAIGNVLRDVALPLGIGINIGKSILK
jgi:hypothetical protein